PAPASEEPAGARDAAAVLSARRLRAVGERRRRAGAVSAVLDAGVSAQLADALQRRDAARAALELLPARLARGPSGRDLPALHGRRAAVEVLGRDRDGLPPGAVARVADREHQRALERDRAVAE